MPVRPAVPSLPVPLNAVSSLLARHGVQVSAKGLQEAASAGAVPSRLQGGRRLVDEADLDTIAAYSAPTRRAAPPVASASRATRRADLLVLCNVTSRLRHPSIVPNARARAGFQQSIPSS